MSAIAELDDRRAALGLTQKTVADVMGVAPSVLSRALRGNTTQSFVDRYRAALDAISRATTVEQIAAIARPIAERHHVDELYLFGSMARGEGTAQSDVDFIYHMTPQDNPVVDVWAFRDDLQQAFGREVDLVRKEYVATPEDDRLAEMQRVLFVNSVTSKPMFRIV